MKKIIALILSLLLLVLPLGGCGGEQDNGKTKIKISVYAAGYGDKWIRDAAALYEKNVNPDIQFVIESDTNIEGTLKTRFEANRNNSDLITSGGLGGYYRYFVRNGYLEDISDVYEKIIPGTQRTVADTVSPQLKEYWTVDEKIYGVPWQDNNTSIVYNAKMFREKGWKVPTTMDEFWELCDTIADANIAPITYGGGQMSGYFPLVMDTWLCQYYGADYIRDDFLSYSSPEVFKNTEAGRLKVYQALARLLQGKTASGKPIAMAGSKGLTAQAAQREFIQGKSAMDVCGPWFPTEMSGYASAFPDFEYGYMPIPHINADRNDVNGNSSANVKCSTDGNVLAIPSNSKNKEIVKDFLVFMLTQDCYKTFIADNNGLMRPYDITIDQPDFTGFTKSCYDFLSLDRKNIVYEVSRAPIYLAQKIGFFLADNGNCLINLINETSYEGAMAKATAYSKGDYSHALTLWDPIKNQWKPEYTT